MPCNIGVKSYSKVAIPAPQPQTFKAKAEAPKIDAELLAKLGNEDPEFLEWAQELDTKPLLEEALKRTLAKIGKKGVEFSINREEMLEAKGKYFSDKEKRELDEIASRVSDRWQFEILGIVTELLGYSAVISQKGNELCLEAEEEGKSHPCDYIKVVKTDRGASLVFEHFKSRKALTVGTAKFLVLAHKLGVKIALKDSTVSEGDPHTVEERHDHRHGHTHDHDHNG